MVLNEEQWIKELREKRIAYGISQGWLAVASGITREYLNKIESGKMKPSKELLETLYKELARFNPEAPLTMLFDYVKIRFPTLDIQHIIKDILKLNINYMLHEDYGHYSYTEHYSLGDIFIYTSADEEKGVLFDDKQVFDEYIRVIEEEYTIDNTIEYDIYKEPNHQVQNFFQSEYYDFDPVLKLSDYNRLLELRKMPLLSLNDNEYYIVTNSKFAYEVEDNKDIETITVANKNLKLKGYDTKSYWNSITNTGRFVVVLPDKYVQGLEVSENHLIIDTKEDTDAELENKIKEDMQHQLVKVDENGEINDESYRVNVRGAEIEQQKAMVAIVVSLFMYIAFILISAVGTILAVQSLSDSTKYKYRYLTLRRLGINDKSLFKTIRKQLLILFCVPAISAILCSFVMMSSLNNVYQQILGDKHLYLMYFGLNLIIFFLIYSIYWIATYIGFKRNINEAS